MSFPVLAAARTGNDIFFVRVDLDGGYHGLSRWHLVRASSDRGKHQSKKNLGGNPRRISGGSWSGLGFPGDCTAAAAPIARSARAWLHHGGFGLCFGFK